MARIADCHTTPMLCSWWAAYLHNPEDSTYGDPRLALTQRPPKIVSACIFILLLRKLRYEVTSVYEAQRFRGRWMSVVSLRVSAGELRADTDPELRAERVEHHRLRLLRDLRLYSHAAPGRSPGCDAYACTFEIATGRPP
jgi:hypothetical protein